MSLRELCVASVPALLKSSPNVKLEPLKELGVAEVKLEALKQLGETEVPALDALVKSSLPSFSLVCLMKGVSKS